VSSQHTSIVRMLERLVAFDTVSSRSNLALIDYVEEYLAGYGIAARRTVDAPGTKANLLATLGPDRAGGIVLSGHSDVVPVEGQPWDTDPFTLRRRDGKLYGRGTSDMKGFIAVALAMVPEFLKADLKVPIHLAITYDEEVGCLGVGALLADMMRHVPQPRLAIIGEPTSMQIVNAHKGLQAFETVVTGSEAHSSQPHRGASAVMAAVELMHFLKRLADEKRDAADAECRFEPPYTTFNIAPVAGGDAVNITARDCRFVWEFRLLPGDDAEDIVARYTAFAEDEVLPALRSIAPNASIVTTPRASVPPLLPEETADAETLLRALTGLNSTGVASYATEGGLFQDAGLSTVVCGPGSIDQAHQPNEFIELSQLDACRELLLALRDWAASPAAK
jgi:acetylornithine deacetylase